MAVIIIVVFREVNYEIEREKMLENFKKLRDDIDKFIKSEEL